LTLTLTLMSAHWSHPQQRGVTSSSQATTLVEEEAQFQNTKEQVYGRAPGTRNQYLLPWRPTTVVSETVKHGRESRETRNQE
jgi:hypothetical protein